jgi:hypothetical protein
MSDKRIFSITHAQGNALFQYCSDRIRWPEKLGEEKFDEIQRSIADDLLKQCRTALRSYSPLVRQERVNCFGNASNWKKDNDGDANRGGRWSLINPDLPIDVHMDEDAQDGAYHALLMMAHPASPAPATLGALDEVVWPIALALGVGAQLRQDLKLDQSAKRRSVKRDVLPSNEVKSGAKEESSKPVA